MVSGENYNKTSKDGYNARNTSTGYKALEAGKFAEAVAYYEAANRETPNQPYYELNLAAAYQRQGRMAEAEPLLRKAIEHGGDVNPTFWTTDLAQDRTVAEIACQNLTMGLAAATVAGAAAKCQRTEVGALVPVAMFTAETDNHAIDYFTPRAAADVPAYTPAPMQTAAVTARGATRSDVYFDFDQATLSPAGRVLVDTVAVEMRNDPTLGARLLGKTDMPGAEPYNMALSDRRATAVKDALIEAGIAANRIDARWVGEMEPPMMTAETAREPRNRVVEITIN